MVLRPPRSEIWKAKSGENGILFSPLEACGDCRENRALSSTGNSDMLQNQR
jgi:hypothetical protein